MEFITSIFRTVAPFKGCSRMNTTPNVLSLSEHNNLPHSHQVQRVVPSIIHTCPFQRVRIQLHLPSQQMLSVAQQPTSKSMEQCQRLVSVSSWSNVNSTIEPKIQFHRTYLLLTSTRIRAYGNEPAIYIIFYFLLITQHYNRNICTL